MPVVIRLLVAIAASLLPFSLAIAAPSSTAASNAPASSCQGDDPYRCPAWMPSQAEMRNTLTDYFCELVDQGRLQLRVEPLVRVESSPLNCGALAPQPGSNFVCGGEMRFIGRGSDIHRIQFSPTLRREQDGRFAIYLGEDENGERVWRVPAPRSESPTCATH